MKLQFLNIEKIQIKQFKKIRELCVEPEKGANLFFGSFRSGKTSLCEFIQFALYGAESVSLARDNAEDAEGRILFSSDKGNFVIQRSVIGGEESLVFRSDSGPIETNLTPGEYLTGLDQDTFDQINYFRQSKYEMPAARPKFSILNRFAGLSEETEHVYRDALVLEKKYRLFTNDEKTGSLDRLREKKATLEKELEEYPLLEKELAEGEDLLQEICEKIDQNDRRCVLLKADMAGFTDDLKLSQNKENAEDLHRKILAKEKECRIRSYEVQNKIGRLSEEELEAMKGDYNRLSLAVTSLTEARGRLSAAQENLAYHETLFVGKNSLESVGETAHQIQKLKWGRLGLYALGIFLVAMGAASALLLHGSGFDAMTCIFSALALCLCAVASLCFTTLITSRMKKHSQKHGLETLPEFYELREKVLAHSKTTEVYRAEVQSAQETCDGCAKRKDKAQSIIDAKVKSLGYRDSSGDLLAICDEIIEANDALYDLLHELEEDKKVYQKLLSENVESDDLTISPAFLGLQKEFTFLAAQNDSLYKKKTIVISRLQAAKEKMTRSDKEIAQELEALKEKLAQEEKAFESVCLNHTLATARKNKFEDDLKKLLAKNINDRLGFLLGQGESFLFDEDFELCFCDQNSVLPLLAAGGGAITEMGLLSFRLALSETLKTTRLPMIFDDSLAPLGAEDAVEFFRGLKSTCSQFFIATSSQELIALCRDEAKVVIL